MSMTVSFAPTHTAWESYESTVAGLIDRYSLRRVCDVGGGANPVLPLSFIQARSIEYTLLDVSSDELAKAPEGYRKLTADVCDRRQLPEGRFDLVFSKMVAEHVPSGREFHTNVFHMLAPGGIAFHFLPTLYSIPFVVNRLMPERLAAAALDAFDPRDQHQYAKFPAYYSWCVGPIPKQLDRLRAIGYEVVEYRGFFGHNYYRKIPGVRSLHRALTRRLLERPDPRATSYAFMILRRP